MTDKQYRAFMDLMMCCDPWPVGSESGDDGHETLLALADEQAQARGYDSWYVAYHEFMRTQEWDVSFWKPAGGPQ